MEAFRERVCSDVMQLKEAVAGYYQTVQQVVATICCPSGAMMRFFFNQVTLLLLLGLLRSVFPFLFGFFSQPHIPPDDGNHYRLWRNSQHRRSDITRCSNPHLQSGETGGGEGYVGQGPLAAQQGPHSERRADSLNGGLQLLSLGHKQPCNNPGQLPASRACAKAARCRAVHVGLGHLRLNVGGCRIFLLRRKKRC